MPGDGSWLADLAGRPHRRYDPLRDAWVLVSAGRDARPWRGETEAPPAEAPLAYDPTCQLCPGNTRASGARNPSYDDVFVFDNDFPALQPGPPPSTAENGLWVIQAVSGVARVLCFSPR